MLRRSPILALLALTMVVSALPVHARAADDPYTIMRPEPGRKPQPQPEPWLAPKYQSPRGTREHISRPRPAQPEAPAPIATVPPPILVPETGSVLPNLPVMSPSGPHGTETFQDRAARCAHQAGVYGDAAGNRSAYIGTCINQ